MVGPAEIVFCGNASGAERRAGGYEVACVALLFLPKTLGASRKMPPLERDEFALNRFGILESALF